MHTKKKFVLSVFSQHISVSSFQVLPNDQTARVHQPVRDQNGEKCALIKVVTTRQGFAWEAGTLGITRIKRKTGEYWVYVPRGSKKITIKHDELGLLRNYYYPVPIEKATVYEMKLATSGNEVTGRNQGISSSYLIVNSEPKKAELYIDNKYRGKTPFSGKFATGKHTYRLNKSKYHTRAGEVELSAEKGRKELDVTLKPRFGSLSVESKPESGLNTFLDGDSTGKKTPAVFHRIASGKHQIELKGKWYQPVNRTVTVRDTQKTGLLVNLTPIYGHVTVETQPPSRIFIDGQRVGHQTYQGRLVEGIHTFTAKKEEYTADQLDKKIVSDNRYDIQLNPQPRYGALDVSSDPINANIFIDGKKYGKTPNIIKELSKGMYQVKLVKEGFKPVERQITIHPNQTSEMEERLLASDQVTVNSKPSGAKLYIDGSYEGQTPVDLALSSGQHQIRLSKEEHQDYQSDFQVKDERRKYTFSLKPSTVGVVQVTSDPPSARLIVNGSYKGRTPVKVKMSSGEAEFMVAKEGFNTKRRTIHVDEYTNDLNFTMSMEGQYYTSKGEALILSAFWPGWGSYKLKDADKWGDIRTVGSVWVTAGYASLLASNNFRFLFYSLYGLPLLADWMVILASDNTSRQKALDKFRSSKITPGIKIQPNRVTGEEQLMFSLKISLN